MNTTYTVRCADCGEQMTFLDYEEHQHPEPAPELLAALQASIPAIGATSQGSGELAGGDVQALPRERRPRSRRGNRHDQRTPLPGDAGFVSPHVTSDAIRDLLR